MQKNSLPGVSGNILNNQSTDADFHQLSSLSYWDFKRLCLMPKTTSKSYVTILH